VGRITTGPDTGNIVVVHAHPNWTSYEKTMSDAEMQRLVQTVYSNTNPPYESFVANIIEEVAL
jgi:hypothetical protein